MKLMTMLFSFALATSAFSGEITNAVTGEKITLHRQTPTQSIQIKADLKSGCDEQEVLSKDMQKILKKTEHLARTRKCLDPAKNCPADDVVFDGNPQVLYKMTKDSYHQYVDDPEGMDPGDLNLFEVVMVGISGALETPFMPYALGRKWVRNSKVNKDMSLLEHMMDSDDKVTVSEERFRRILALIGHK